MMSEDLKHLYPRRIFDEPTLQPIAGEIMAEAHEDAGLVVTTVRQRYGCLTTPLPLRGAEALKRNGDGELMLVAALRDEASWLEPVIATLERRLERQLLVGEPWVAISPMLLVGPPGCGKSWIARRIGELAVTGHRTIDLAGAMDSTIIHGNPRGWHSQMPSIPVLAMAETRCANPLCIVEEVEKAGGSERYGDPIAALLALLEPSTARCYRDRCLQTEVDVSAVNWIMTANAITPRLPPPFLSRIEVIEVAMPPADMVDVLIEQLLADLARRWRLPPTMPIELTSRVMAQLRQDYRRHSSIRRLQRMIEAVAAYCLPERQVH